MGLFGLGTATWRLADATKRGPVFTAVAAPWF